ncbi:hypothetical protein EV426DRAFT_643735 [Tirmania nivea]|nr:hypothetical protein EV426DRAFT_643735 [Tirmania nivea]
MGCVVSRKVSTSSTGSPTSSCGYSTTSTTSPPLPTSTTSTTSHSSLTSASVQYSIGATTLQNSSPALFQGSTCLVKPECAYSPVDSPPRRCEREKSFSSALGGINSLFRSKRVFNSMSDIPLTDANNTTLTATPFSKQKILKSKRPTKPSSSPQAPTESKLEISWPTSCHHIPVPPLSAVALGYPYPYPFPLSTVPSDPDLVATAEAAEEGVKREQGGDAGGRQGEGVSCGYYGYEYECLVQAGKEGARGGVRLEIKPGRNPKWEEEEEEEKEVVDGGREV